MTQENASISRLKRLVWKAGGHAGLLIALLVTFSLGYLLNESLRPTPSSQTRESPDPSEADASADEVWTCSMHPQIQLPEPGQCPICGMTLIPRANGGGGMAGKRRFTTTDAAKALMNIQTSAVERRFVPAEIRMVGKVDYDETKLGYITAWVPGRLDRLYVDYTGVVVNKGDHMVYLYSPELLAGQDELRRAAENAKRVRPDSPEALKRVAETGLEAARDKLRRWGLTDNQIKEAERTGISSDHITVYAPMGGTVIHRSGQEGMYVQEGTNIYTIADLSKVWLLLDAYESDLAWLHLGQTVEFTTEAYPGDTFTGKITFIDPVLDKTTRTVKVRVNVPNEDGRLKPEMFARAIVRAQVATGGRVMDPGLAGKWIGPMHPEIVQDGPGTCDICGMTLVKAEDLGYVSAVASVDDMPLVIPASAPLLTGTRAVVYVKIPGRDKPTYEGREVVLGPRTGHYYIVRNGLAEGERVVTNGNFQIDSALQIMAKPSMMSPEGGGGGGGHKHGGAMKMTKEQMKSPMMQLSDASKDQFALLGRAFAALDEADAAQVDSAFKAFREAIGQVDMSLLRDRAHQVWMEYSMRLKNDTVEAQDAAGTARLDPLLNKMSENLGILWKQLGLESPGTGDSKSDEARAPTDFQQQVRALFGAYLGLQNSLAADRLEAARMAAIAARAAVDAMDMTRLSGPSHKQWMGYEATMKAAFTGIEKAEDIGGIRMAFEPLGKALGEAITSFGVAAGSPIYEIHCPMALDNEGAVWLQMSKKTLNPYLGQAMPACGSLVRVVYDGRADAASQTGSTGQQDQAEGGHDE